MTVLFKPIMVADELRRLADSSKDLLIRHDHLRLRAAAEQLEGWFQSSRPGGFHWTLDEPIQTKNSSFYQGTGTAAEVSANFTFLWNCERTDTPEVASAGNGGTDIVVVRSTGNKVNEYHFDLCVGGAVGTSPVMHCFSHAQYSAGTSFPRFPSMLLLPTDVLEMLLFELWPSEWPNTIEGDRNKLLKHHLAQRKRLGRMAKAFQNLATKRFPLVSLHAALPAPIQLF
ncbi:hypothetical protein [Devosia riboflavina]